MLKAIDIPYNLDCFMARLSTEYFPVGFFPKNCKDIDLVNQAVKKGLMQQELSPSEYHVYSNTCYTITSLAKCLYDFVNL